MDTINPSIGCTVQQCRFNDDGQNLCTLSKIMVGTHEEDPTEKECTDCNSFEKK